MTQRCFHSQRSSGRVPPRRGVMTPVAKRALGLVLGCVLGVGACSESEGSSASSDGGGGRAGTAGTSGAAGAVDPADVVELCTPDAAASDAPLSDGGPIACPMACTCRCGETCNFDCSG